MDKKAILAFLASKGLNAPSEALVAAMLQAVQEAEMPLEAAFEAAVLATSE